MSSKTSCSYFQPSKAFLILFVVFLVLASKSVVFGQSVECHCEVPVDDKSYATRAEYACNGRSTITCHNGGCATVDIEYTAPENLQGKTAIAKGCKTASFLSGCVPGTGDKDGVKSTINQCFCDTKLCNDKASPPPTRTHGATSAPANGATSPPEGTASSPPKQKITSAPGEEATSTPMNNAVAATTEKSGSMYLRSNFALLTSCVLSTTLLSLFLFNRK